MIKIVIVLVTSTLLCQAAVVKESCNTPEGKEGLCICLRKCPSISSMSTDFDTPMTIERLNYLIDSLCGYADKSPKVCCPVEEVTMIKTEVTTNSEIQTTLSTSEETTTSIQIGYETTSSNEIR
ncbi:uncharacterized protein LOC108909088 [Anoplophora glabripennis]|uniref:uncharacterized protein LOC108909088 n=1 Tax=Anoplophora glabripennis TaxID=217634 RepID=UPI000874B2F6|nr:uncharacterized protein LOC108909088 [Anoplophora glabripennis]